MPRRLPVQDRRSFAMPSSAKEEKASVNSIAAQGEGVLMPSKTLDMLNRFLAQYAALSADNMGLSDTIASSSSSSTPTPDALMKHDSVCDICDRQIVGKRYKCLQCHDWDCCSSCNTFSAKLHPGHDLICIDRQGILPEKLNAGVWHNGVICDACENEVLGPRFKCITCPDFDLCRNCEAHPLRPHKHHLFLKIDTPVTITKKVLAQSKIAAIDAAEPTESSSSIVTPTALNTGPGSISSADPQARTDASSNTRKDEDPDRPKAVCDAQRMDSEKPRLSAAVIREISFPDHSTVLAGSHFDKIWLVKNSGTEAWPVHVDLRIISQLGDKLFDAKDARSVSGIVCSLHGESVKPGDEALIRATNIKAPSTAGRVRCFFKLAARQGRSSVLFGEQLWIDVQVVQHDDSSESNEISGSSVLLAPAAPNMAPSTDAESERSTNTSGHARRLAEWKASHGVVHRYADPSITPSNPPTSTTTGSLLDDGSDRAWDTDSHLSLPNDDDDDDDDDDFEHIDVLD